MTNYTSEDLRNFTVVWEEYDGKRYSDKYSALTSKEAIEDFKNCHRHDVKQIISVEFDVREVTEENA